MPREGGGESRSDLTPLEDVIDALDGHTGNWKESDSEDEQVGGALMPLANQIHLLMDSVPSSKLNGENTPLLDGLRVIVDMCRVCCHGCLLGGSWCTLQPTKVSLLGESPLSPPLPSPPLPSLPSPPLPSPPLPSHSFALIFSSISCLSNSTSICMFEALLRVRAWQNAYVHIVIPSRNHNMWRTPLREWKEAVGVARVWSASQWTLQSGDIWRGSIGISEQKVNVSK